MKVKIVGADCTSGWYDEEYDCSLKIDSKIVDDGDELTFAAGMEMSVEIVPGYTNVWGSEFENVYASLIEIRYEPGFHDGRCYGIGGAYNSDGDYYNTAPTTSFQYVVDGDMTLYVEFGDLRSNYQCITLTGEHGEVTTLAGHTYETGDTFVIDSLPSNRNPKCWTALDLNADGLVPMVTFGGYSEGDYLFEGNVYGDTIEWTTVGALNITIEFVRPTIGLAGSQVLETGDTTLLDIDVQPYNPGWTDFGIEWSSADTDIVSVDPSGKIIGVSAGETTVSVTVHYGNLRFTEECKVTVNAPPEYEITVISGGHGTITSSHQRATAGTEVYIGVSPETGCMLKRITATGGAVLRESEGGYTFTMPASDVIIQADFNQVMYTVEFYNDDVLYHAGEFAHGDPLSFPEPDPSRDPTEYELYQFAGWVDEDGNPVSAGTAVVGDMALYADYDASVRLYDIVFVVGNQTVEHFRQEYGEPIVPPVDPVMDGYDFIGWNGYAQGMEVTGDATFTAVFQKVPEPVPPYIPGDDDSWIPPNIVYEDDDGEDPWIFVVLGCTALLLFLLFFRYERRE